MLVRSSFFLLLALAASHFYSASSSSLYAYDSSNLGNAYIASRMCGALSGVPLDVSKTTIEIGISTVISGSNAPWETNTMAGTLLAIDEVNASDEILKGIKLIPTFGMLNG